MASKGLQPFARSIGALRAFNARSKDPLVQCLAPQLSRSMATEAPLPSEFTREYEHNASSFQMPEDPNPSSSVITTIYKFPEMEPLRFEYYNSKHLHLPLRRDILHRAVIFEGDMTRQGTASTKTRWEVHGSHRKIRPQKGTGMARLGTRQSPMLRGGGKSFGPHPRDFATQLPRKIYDLAWRTALSYRYRKGQLIVCDDGMDFEHPKGEWAAQVFEHNRWGKSEGRSLVVTADRRENLFAALDEVPEHGRALTTLDVDVKDLLETGRVVIEKSALDEILQEHQSDLIGKVRNA